MSVDQHGPITETNTQITASDSQRNDDRYACIGDVGSCNLGGDFAAVDTNLLTRLGVHCATINPERRCPVRQNDSQNEPSFRAHEQAA
jgi:hypothetical protein